MGGVPLDTPGALQELRERPIRLISLLKMSRKQTSAAGLAALLAIAGVVFTALALTPTKIGIGVAILSLLTVAWRRFEHAPPLDPIQVVAVVVFLLSVTWIIISAVGVGGENRSAPDPRHEASPGKVVRVYNKVTSGPRRMRDDDEQPVSLTTKAVAFCDERDCRIPGTNRETGETYNAAVCQRQGERVTNGQNTSRVDNHNPGLFSSRRYYGVRLDEDTFGYVSEVWINPKDRGGRGLPQC